jgi:TatA/E family protein of Tat protein translocase
MPQLGPAEVLVILVVALLVFGPKRLPEVGRQVGRGLRELRKIQETVRDEINDVIHHEDPDDGPPGYPSPPPVPASVPANASGRHAPSRYRPAATPALGAGAASILPEDDVTAEVTAEALADAPTDAPVTPVPVGRPAHAPSRFRVPGR